MEITNSGIQATINSDVQQQMQQPPQQAAAGGENVRAPPSELEIYSKLCDSVIQWQTQNMVRTSVNKNINWDDVAGILGYIYNIQQTGDECHRQWKFIAYGRKFGEIETLVDLDIEDSFLQPIEPFERLKSPEEISEELEKIGKSCSHLKRKIKSSTRDLSAIKVFVPNRIGNDMNSIKSITYRIPDSTKQRPSQQPKLISSVTVGNPSLPTPVPTPPPLMTTIPLPEMNTSFPHGLLKNGAKNKKQKFPKIPQNSSVATASTDTMLPSFLAPLSIADEIPKKKHSGPKVVPWISLEINDVIPEFRPFIGRYYQDPAGKIFHCSSVNVGKGKEHTQFFKFDALQDSSIQKYSSCSTILSLHNSSDISMQWLPENWIPPAVVGDLAKIRPQNEKNQYRKYLNNWIEDWESHEIFSRNQDGKTRLGQKYFCSWFYDSEVNEHRKIVGLEWKNSFGQYLVVTETLMGENSTEQEKINTRQLYFINDLLHDMIRKSDRNARVRIGVVSPSATVRDASLARILSGKLLKRPPSEQFGTVTDTVDIVQTSLDA